jgi:hypothetical protein|tara:strand:- start:1011 stop:1700 length:690 start_codon:yes stop_codon:yes gene_type:complete
MEVKMKYVFCIDNQEEDLKKIQIGEIEKFTENENVLIIPLDKTKQKETILNYLSELDDEYIVFVPNNNLLVEKIDDSKVNYLKQDCIKNQLSYCRLTEMGNINSVADKNSEIHPDKSSIFFKCPYIFKTDKLKQIISTSLDGEMFWISMDLSEAAGSFVYKNKLDEDTPQSLYSCVPTLINVIDQNKKWAVNFIDFNKKVLRDKIAEYNIDIEQRNGKPLSGEFANDMG